MLAQNSVDLIEKPVCDNLLSTMSVSPVRLTLLFPLIVSLAALDQPTAAPGSSEAARDAIVNVRPDASDASTTPADPRTPSGPPRLVVAVLPFENRTGDSALDDWQQALASLVRPCLERADSTRTPGRDTIQSALKRSDWTAGNGVDTAQALDLAREAKANVIVWGRYRRQGDDWTADLQVLRVGGETPQVEIQATAPQWVDLAESIALHVAEQLDRRIAEDERRLWRMTVPSTEAAATRFAHAVNLEIREAPAAERESAWREVLAADPQCGMAHGSLIRLLSEAQRKSECRQAADEFIRQQPSLCYAHLTHAWMLGMDGEVAAAEAALREALRLHPDCPEATEGLFDVLATTGRWADLVSALEGTLDRRPDDEPARAFLAAALAQTGKLAEARDLLKPIAEPPEESELVDLALLQAALAVGHIELAGLELQRLGTKTATNPQIRSTLDSTKLIIRRPPGGHADPPILRPRAFTPEELNTELERRLTPEEQKLAVNPLETTPELVAEARRLTTGLTNDALRSFALFAEVCRRGRGSGDGGQRTASEALKDSRDPETRLSCQEHAKLFVALARAIGLEAWLAHIERGADGLSAYHDCAALFLEGQGLLVDPAWSVFGVRHEEFTVLDDLQAISHQAMQSHPNPDPRSFRMGLKLNPDDRWTRLQFVRGMARAGELDAADRVLEQVRSGGTATWDVHDAAAVVAIGRDQWRRALADLQRALESSPSNVVVHLRLAGVFAELGDPLKSAHHMQKALELNRGGISKETWREHQFGIEVMNAFTQARSDSTGSLETLERRAQAGDLPAQMAMARACFETRPPRTDEGMRWLKKAVEQGDPQAQFHYARNLLLVRGQSAIAESMQWLTRSAEQGYDDAQYQLGLVLYEGELAPRDNVAGAQWVYLAADQGHVEARRLLKELQIILKPQEMTDARQRADAFKPVKQRGTPP